MLCYILIYHFLFCFLFTRLQTLGLLSLRDSLLESSNSRVNVVAVGVSDTDTHVTETDVLGGNLLVKTGCEDDAALQQQRQHIGGQETLGQVDGSHAVSLVLRLRSKLRQTQLGDGGLDAVRGLGVSGEALRQRTRGDLG